MVQQLTVMIAEGALRVWTRRRLRSGFMALIECGCVGLLSYVGVAGDKPGWGRVAYGGLAGAVAMYFYLRASVRRRRLRYDQELSSFVQHQPGKGEKVLMTFNAVARDGGVTVMMQVNASHADAAVTASILTAVRDRVEYEIRAQAAPLN